MSKKASRSALEFVEEEAMVPEDDRYQRRSRPGMRAFEGASMGGPERYTEEEISVIVQHADEFVKALGKALDSYVPADAAAKPAKPTKAAPGAKG